MIAMTGAMLVYGQVRASVISAIACRTLASAILPEFLTFITRAQPRWCSCERWPSRLAYHWRSMLLVRIEHKCFKMFAHKKLSGIGRFRRCHPSVGFVLQNRKKMRRQTQKPA